MNADANENNTRQTGAETLDQVWQRVHAILCRINGRFQLTEKWEETKSWASANPLKALFAMVTVALVSAPLACFMTFIFITTVMTFLGFVIFEGMLLIMGTLVFGGSLFVVGSFALGISSFVIAIWYMYNMVIRMIHRLRGSARSRQVFGGGYNLFTTVRPEEASNGECVLDTEVTSTPHLEKVD